MRATLFSLTGMIVLCACGVSSTPAVSTNVQQAADTKSNSSDRPFAVAEVASFSTPWALDFLPDGSALVTEKEGKLWHFDLDTGDRREVSGVPQVKVAGQGGLGDVVVHPDFSSNRRIYLTFVEPGSNDTSGAALGYGTLTETSGKPAIEDFRVIWRQTPKVTGNGHFSHRIAFAPDGSLFLTSGDRQKLQPAQDLGSDLGKIIHLTAEGEVIPGPWANRGGRAGSYHSMGHRNMLGVAFDPQGRLWVSEMGPKGGDELNLVEAGRNYGWPEVSYGDHYDGENIPDAHRSAGFEEPKVHWTPVISPGGLMFYDGAAFPQWRGDAFVPGLSGQALVRVEIDGDTAREAERWDMGKRIRAVAQGPDGAIFLLEDGRGGPGRMLRLQPARR